MTSGTCDRDMWFWKAFTNAMVLARGGPFFLQAAPDMRDTEQLIARLIKAWSRTTGVITWAEAKQTLHRVVWYYNGPETFARRTWEKNMA